MTVKNIHQGTLCIHILIMNSSTSTNPELIISKLAVAGINYRHAAVTERSLFSVSSAICQAILESAKEKRMRSVFVLSTCNRTEIYGYCQEPEELAGLLLQHTKGTAPVFRQAGFVKRGAGALQHLFEVAAGLDSQIIGDFEVLGQLKTAVAFSRKQGLIGPVMDRTVNFVLQASKAIRTNTKLSSGTVSVSYAAIQWLEKIADIDRKRMLLFGTGKFGTTLAKNLRHYYSRSPITIINRTDETARWLAGSLSLGWKPFSALAEEIRTADIVLVCTNAASYTVYPHFFPGQKDQWILDLSVPENTDPAIKNIPGVRVTGIDEVSGTMKATLAKRNSEIPKALAIIEEFRQAFYEWLHLQRHIPLINEIKGKLYELGEIHFVATANTGVLSSRVNKTVGSLAMNLRYKREKGCHYINAINEFLQPGTSHE